MTTKSKPSCNLFLFLIQNLIQLFPVSYFTPASVFGNRKKETDSFFFFMASTEIASRPSTADPHIFTIKAATLKFETRHDLLPYLTPLIENTNVEEAHLSGNTYGVEACEFLGQVLSTKKNLKVPVLAPLRVALLTE